MLHKLCYITYVYGAWFQYKTLFGLWFMSVGNSGRIVIEIDPELKQELHAVLRLEGTNLKAWFLAHVEEFLAEKGQKSLIFEDGQQAKEAHL